LRKRTTNRSHLVDETLVTDWRIATIDCLSELIGSSPRRKLVASAIFETFIPVISPKTGPREHRELEQQFQRVCDEAWDVAMIMRRSRERHRCIVPPTSTTNCSITAYETLAEPIIVEGGNNKDASDEIAYSLFGALVKTPQHHGGSKMVVLEKAQVVLKAAHMLSRA
jgi:hypothetical protein